MGVTGEGGTGRRWPELTELPSVLGKGVEDVFSPCGTFVNTSSWVGQNSVSARSRGVGRARSLSFLLSPSPEGVGASVFLTEGGSFLGLGAVCCLT